MNETVDFEILTEIQHYGGKTNLIDFTTDYLIALFFACDGHHDKEGRIIMQKTKRNRRYKFGILKIHDIVSLHKKVYSFDILKVLLNQAMRRQ